MRTTKCDDASRMGLSYHFETLEQPIAGSLSEGELLMNS